MPTTKKPSPYRAMTALQFASDPARPVKERMRTALSLFRHDPEAARPIIQELLTRSVGDRLRSRAVRLLERNSTRGVKKQDKDFTEYCQQLRDGGSERRKLFIDFHLPGLVPLERGGPFGHILDVIAWVKETYPEEWADGEARWTYRKLSGGRKPPPDINRLHRPLAVADTEARLAERRRVYTPKVLKQKLQLLRDNKTHRVAFRNGLANGTWIALPEELALLKEYERRDKNLTELPPKDTLQ